MAHERAGSYYLSQDNGPAAAEQYATALTKYFNWEGMAKVRTLKRFMETAPFYTDKTTEKCRRYLQERTESRSAQLGFDSSSKSLNFRNHRSSAKWESSTLGLCTK